MNNSEKNYNQVPAIKTLQAFEQTARLGSVAKAAEVLSLTPSAVSHQIAKLEEMIGQSLFIRGARGVTLTPSGERYYQEVTNILHSLVLATEQASNNSPKDSLYIHSSPSFGLLWLMPRLESFKEKYPLIQVNLSCSYENLHFTRDKIDIDIRHGISNWTGVEIRTVRSEKLEVLASPKLLERSPVFKPKDLLKKELILSKSTLVTWPQWFAHQGLSIPEFPYTFSFDRSYMSLEAATHGLGFVLESNILTQNYLESGKLVKVFSDDFSIAISAHHLVYPRTHENIMKVNHFLNWINEEINKSSEW
nr:LysR substrate-binding domain-containing protein [Acinetobacter sp. F-1]